MLGFTSASGQGSPLLAHPPPGQGLPGPSLDKLPQIAHHCPVHRWGDTTSGSDQVVCSVPRGWGCWGIGRPGRQGKRRPGQLLNLDHGSVEG